MKKLIVAIALGLPALASACFGFDDTWGGYGMMGYGGPGALGLLGIISWSIWTVAGILVIAFLWQKINKKDGGHR